MQCCIMRSTSLGVAEPGNIKYDFVAKKASQVIIFGLNTFLDVVEIPKPQKSCWPHGQ